MGGDDAAPSGLFEMGMSGKSHERETTLQLTREVVASGTRTELKLIEMLGHAASSSMVRLNTTLARKGS